MQLTIVIILSILCMGAAFWIVYEKGQGASAINSLFFSLVFIIIIAAIVYGNCASESGMIQIFEVFKSFFIGG